MQQASQSKDRYGLPITTSSPLAAERYMEGLDIVLSQNYGAEEKFKEAVESDEGLALGHSGLALLSMLRGAVTEAKASADLAKEHAKGATRREQEQVEALWLFVNGQGAKSLALIKEHIKEHPRDVLMLRLSQRLYVQGCSGAGVASFPEEFFGLMRSVESAYGPDWAFMGNYAWAHHEIGQIEAGRALAERSLALKPDNSVAAHSVAHVYFETGDHTSGEQFLGAWIEQMDRRASYRVHLSWHQALFELALGRYGQVREQYENNIRPSVMEKSPTSLSDSASLMWRLHMCAGSAPDGQREEVAEQAAPATDSPGPSFRDSHAALAFGAAGDEARMGRLIDRLSGLAEQGNRVAKEVTLPMVQGINAFAQQEHDEAVRHIEPLYPQLTRIGGSHAQREVFEDTLLEAYLRAEQYEKAEDMLRNRLGMRPSTRDTYRLGKLQVSTGRTDEASTTLREATQKWDTADAESAEMDNLRSLTQGAS